MIVVDASALLVALTDDGEHGVRARTALRDGQHLTAPELIDLEVVSAVRGLERAKKLGRVRALAAVDDLSALPISRVGHRWLMERSWELRHDLTVYDAAYVALAELADCPLVTADARIARATGPRCEFQVLQTAG